MGVILVYAEAVTAGKPPDKKANAPQTMLIIQHIVTVDMFGYVPKTLILTWHVQLWHLMTWTMVCSQQMTLLQRACAQSLEEYRVIKKRTVQVKDIGTIIIVETILVHIAGILDRSVMYDADIK